MRKTPIAERWINKGLVNMQKDILIIYKGGISKFTVRKEEWIGYEANLSLDAVISKVCEKYNFTGNDHIINKRAVLLMLNGKFIPTWQAENIKLNRGDVVTLFPTVSGG